MCARSGSPGTRTGLAASAYTHTERHFGLRQVSKCDSFCTLLLTGSMERSLPRRSAARSSKPGANAEGSSAMKHCPRLAFSPEAPQRRMLGPYAEPAAHFGSLEDSPWAILKKRQAKQAQPKLRALRNQLTPSQRIPQFGGQAKASA